jgi:15-cis-phytoene synthase
MTAQSLTLSRDYRQLSSTVDSLIRAHSKTFYFATGLLPRRERAAIRALYAFCRSTDDLVDRQGATASDVEAWRRQVHLPPQQQQLTSLLAWATIRQQYTIEPRYEDELIDGVRMDIERHTYATWTELKNYCYHVASTVGLLSMPIIGLAKGAEFEQAAGYAIQLGIALQLTNILRDVGEDARQGRIYLPIEDLAAYHLTTADIYNGVVDERFIGLMQFEINRAQDLYAQALPGIALLSPGARPAVGAAALLYRAILCEIEVINYQVHRIRAHTSALRKLQMLPGILWQVQRLKAPAQ